MLVPITYTGSIGSTQQFTDGQDASTVHIAPYSLAMARDGSLLVADQAWNRIVRITDPAGVDPKIYLVAGSRTTYMGTTYEPDGTGAANVGLCGVTDVGVLDDGTVVWEENCTGANQCGHSGCGNLIRRVRPDGGIETLVGQTVDGYINSTCATSACVAKQQSISTAGQFAVGGDGSIYFGDWGGGLGNPACDVWRVTTDGMMHRLGGTGTCGMAKNDGGDALSAQFNAPSSMRTDGTSLLIGDVQNYAVRRINGEGIVETLAGKGGQLTGTGIVKDTPAKSSNLSPPLYSSDPVRSLDGWVYVISQINVSQYIVARFGTPQAGTLVSGDELVLSSDGSELFEFDPNGRHVATRSPERGKNLYTFGYDTGGTNELTSITDVASNVVNLVYTCGGSPICAYGTITISSTHDGAKLTTLTLDGSGYLHTVANANGETWTMLYDDSNGRLTSFKPPNGQAHGFTYTWDGLLSKDSSPISGTSGTQLVASDIGLTHTVDVITAEGHDTQHVVSHAYSTELNSNKANLIETRTHTDPAGLATVDKRYDDSSSLVTYPDGTSVTTTYTADPRFGFDTPRVASSTLVTGTGTNQKTIASSVTYGTPTLSNSGDPTTLTYEQDSYTVGGQTFKRTFNAQTSPATVTLQSPVGRTVVMQLDDATDRVTKISVPGLNDVNVTYDSERIGNITQGSHSVTNHYDSTGFLDQIISSARGTTTFSNPDGINRPQGVALPGTPAMTIGYDADGNVQTVVTPNGNSHGMTYNPVDLLGVYNPPTVTGGGSTSYSYNLDGAFLVAAYPGGPVRYRGYDQAGRLSTESYTNPVDGSTLQTTWSYSSSGSSAGHVSTINGTDVNLTYTYDGEMQKSETFAVNGSFSHTVNKTYASYPPLALSTRYIDADLGSTFTYCYDNDGLISGVAVGTSTCANPSYVLNRSPTNGMVTSATAGAMSESYLYDGSGALTDYSVNSGGIYHLHYTRDLPGGDERVHTETETLTSVENCSLTYGYDTANRLHTVSSSGTGCPASGTYTYDNDGNMSGWSYDAQDRLTTNWTYTANGDASQQTNGAYRYYFYYDVLGNLRRWYYTSNGVQGRTQAYKIDGRNRRIARMIVNGSTLTLDHGWLYEGDRVIGEVDSSGNVLSHFAYVTKPNVPDLMLKKVSGNWVLYRLISDQVGTVKAVVQVSNASVAQTLTYQDVWGSTYGTGSSPFGFAGGVFESYPLTYRFGARDYNPFQRRWLSKDRIRFRGDYNFYRYCNDDPVNCIDRTGHFAIPWVGAIGGTSEGVGAATLLLPFGALSLAGYAIYATINFTQQMDDEDATLWNEQSAEEGPGDETVDAGESSGADDIDPLDESGAGDDGADEQCRPKENEGRRGRFKDPEEILDQADSIDEQQQFERQQGRPNRIESTNKSEQRLKNALKNWSPDDDE